MKVALFIGIESFNWKVADFQPAVNLAQAMKIDTLLVKVFDGMQGEWYSGQFPAIHSLVTAAGLECVPYGFHYGNNKGSSLSGEAALAVKFGQQYGTYCADMERSWDGQGDWAGQLAGLIQVGQRQKAFEFWVSTWANVGDESEGHSWLTNIGHLAPVTRYFMPQAYSDALYGLMVQDWSRSAASKIQIQPTFDLSQEFGANDPVARFQEFAKNFKPELISLWEYGFVSQFQIQTNALLEAIKRSVSTGEGSEPVILSHSGSVCDVTQSNQLDGGSQDKCGPWAVSALKYAGLPGKGPAGSQADIEKWASAEYVRYIGPDVPADQQGSSIDNMHQFLHDAGNLHWWDIASISGSSTQSGDLAHIRAAVKAGYPVLVTVSEPSVHSKRLGRNPYPWQPALGGVNHILPVIGIDKDGDYICADQLNAFEPWPQTYLAASIDISWASVVQIVGPSAAAPWLKPIPSGDPTAWTAGFDAQTFGVPPVPAVNDFPQEARDCWNSLSGQFQAIAQALNIAPPAGFHFSPPMDTGICGAWQEAWLKGHHFGPPLTLEYHSLRKDGTNIIVQEFAHARCEWDGRAHWYSIDGEVVV